VPVRVNARHLLVNVRLLHESECEQLSSNHGNTLQHEPEHSCAYARLLLVGVGLPHVSEALSA
jgi:hypothetical protein